MNRGRWIALLSLTTLIGLPAAQAQQAADTAQKPLLQTLFTNNDANGWKSLKLNISSGTPSMEDKTKVIKDETRSSTDKSVLQYDYMVAKGEVNLLLLTVNENEITNAHSIRFTVKADYPTMLAASLQEKGGGRYVALFHVPGGKWQNVVLSPADFILARDNNDPVDPNGKLDMDQVENVAITDGSQIFAQVGDPGIAQLFNVRAGSHSLYLGDFTVSREAVPGAVSQSDPRLDTFAGPQLNWVTVGSVEIAPITGKPLTGRGMSASYHQSSDRIAGLMHAFAQGKLDGKTALHLTLASEKAAKIVVQLEEQGGGKYNTVIEVPAGSVATPFTIKFADLKPSDDSKDENGKFDADKVKQIVLIDLSGMVDKANTDNTLCIGDLRVE